MNSKVLVAFVAIVAVVAVGVGVFFLLMANFISRKLGERGIW